MPSSPASRARALAAVGLTVAAVIIVILTGDSTRVQFAWYLTVAAIAAIGIYLITAPGDGRRPSRDADQQPH